MKIKFVPQNIEVEANPNKSLLQIATENNLEIRSICKGVPSCAECRIRLTSGESNVLPPTKAELNLIGTNYFIDGRRLSCQVHCFGDVTVDLTEQIERQENQTKKIRGFRTGKQVESKAVNDTMLLSEKDEHPQQQQQQQSQPQNQNQQPRQHQQQRQHQNQNQNQQKKNQDQK
jgi:ferredoxin